MQAQSSLWSCRFACVGLNNNNGSKRVLRVRVRVRAMRAVVQRVSSASVEVEGRIVSEIGPGLLVLVGIHDSDSDSDADYMYFSLSNFNWINFFIFIYYFLNRCRKVLNMRLFPNENTGKAWDHSVMLKNYQVLLGNYNYAKLILMMHFFFLFFVVIPSTNCLFVTVSQFTLYGFLKGNKPDFHVAMSPQSAKPFYASLVDRFRSAYNSDAIKGMLSICVSTIPTLLLLSLTPLWYNVILTPRTKPQQ